MLALFLGSVCTVWPGSEIAQRSLPELDAEGRPILTGAELTHATADGRFLIHYTQAGADSAGDDAKAAELLAWAEEGFSRTWAAFVDEDGWIPPHPDGTIGGDARLDVYVRALDNNGYAHAQSVAGKQACWIELDPATRAFGQETFASIAGHELHHCLQFTVANSRVGGAFLYEGTATWAQYLLFKGDPTIDLARQVLWQIRLGSSARALFATGDRFEYAGMLWFKFLLDHGARAGRSRARRAPRGRGGT